MLSWTISFLIIALVAGLLGFTGIAGVATSIAKVLFAIFLFLFVCTLLLTAGWLGNLKKPTTR